MVKSDERKRGNIRKLLFNGKKGQFYIFIAIILVTYVLTISPPKAEPKKPVPVFKQLRQNYEFEAPKVVNAAIYDGANVTERFMNFSDAFIEYSRSRQAKFGMVYLLAHKAGIDIKNYLTETANISYSNTSFLLTTNSWRTIERAGNVSVYLGEIEYMMGFTKTNEAKAVFKSAEEKEVSVYVYD